MKKSDIKRIDDIIQERIVNIRAFNNRSKRSEKEIQALDESWKAIKAALPPPNSVAFYWSVVDVDTVLDEVLHVKKSTLTKAQKMEVLRFLDRNHDGAVGVNWEGIEEAIEHLYGDLT